ncbi:MAG: polynucleotide adenylyltransferase [Spartobacteria bacterium]|nr:polynucleotide adenylyltransferase [Spartobacteria bacterium]
MDVQYPSQSTGNVVDQICRLVDKHGGRAYLVGGSVRDALLGHPVSDIDIEVFGIDSKKIIGLLASRFRVSLVGKAFGVIKLCDDPIDVSLPRRESRMGAGHRAFHVQSDPSLSLEEAALRRDFTINAMAYDPLKRELVDFFGGKSDLADRCLRHVSDKFSEDPLRVLRGMQFCGRFMLTAHAETIALCSSLTQDDLSSERLMGEWKKLITKGVRPSMGLRFLRQTGWLQYYPELEALIGCEQNSEWHPEGDVWAHTLLAMDGFAMERTLDPVDDLCVGFAVLCHDFGKPYTSCIDAAGRIVSPRHEAASRKPAESFLRRLTNSQRFIDSVIILTTQHMQPFQLHKNGASDAAIRRLARRVGRIDQLVRVDRADRFGRSPDSTADQSCGIWLMERARALAVADAAPSRIILGRHLIALGYTPSSAFRPVLDAVYDAQIEGLFFTEDDGVEWVKHYLKKKKIKL